MEQNGQFFSKMLPINYNLMLKSVKIITSSTFFKSISFLRYHHSFSKESMREIVA